MAKRIHIGLDVEDIAQSVGFYTDLLGAPPVVLKSDYAKWMLDDPRVNLSITSKRAAPGGVHFGVQVENEAELSEVSDRLARAGRNVLAEPGAVCCYHRSDKAWVVDPDKFRWETFFTSGESTVYGENNAELDALVNEKERCCD